MNPRSKRRKRQLAAMLLVVFALLVSSRALLAADRRVVALPAAPGLQSPETTFATALTLLLRKHLSELDSVVVADGARVSAVVRDLGIGEAVGTSDGDFAAFNRYFNVDGLVLLRVSSGELFVYVGTARGTGEARFDCAPESLYAAGAFVCKGLGLSQADTSAVLRKRFPSDRVAMACYAAPCLGARWPANHGEVRLKYLHPYLDACRTNVTFQSLMLRSAGELLGARNRSQSYATQATSLAEIAFPFILGTPAEASARDWVRYGPKSSLLSLLELTEPLLLGDDDASLDALLQAPSDSDGFMDVAPQYAKPEVTSGMRLSALRLLGYRPTIAGKAQRAFDRILEAATVGNAHTRAAAAEALCVSQFSAHPATRNRALILAALSKRRVQALAALRSDPDRRVAFIAAYQLWQERDEVTPGLFASACELRQEPRLQARAAEVIGRLAEQKDIALLKTLAADKSEGLRVAAATARLRLNAVATDDLPIYLADHELRVLTAALAASPERSAATPELLEAAIRLANDPYDPVKAAARLACARLRPEDPQAQLRFDLRTEHPYIRGLLLKRLADRSEIWVPDLMAEACGNSDADIRADALRLLTAADPTRARPLVWHALRDASAWVRLQAAALAEFLATAGAQATIRASLDAETEPATRAYLEGALARAEGRPPPPPLKAVNVLPDDRNVTWYCGGGRYPADSPFDAYYLLSATPNAHWRDAHARGKVCFPRMNPLAQPGSIIVSPQIANNFRAAIDSGFDDDNLPIIDGVVFGEETMNLKSASLWQDGWPLFCWEAGLDPQRVAGKIEGLSVVERRAWENWAMERSVDGFNKMVEYVKLKYGKLRPGLLVATFLPGDTSELSRPAVRRWQFDIGALYDYKGDNRLACYSLLRRYKTLWPERRTLWLSLGIGGYEMNVVKHGLNTPQAPFFWRRARCYADALTAWMAGADTGWFSVWMFVDKDYNGDRATLSGVMLPVESIAPQSPVLLSGISRCFRGVEKETELKAATRNAPQGPNSSLNPADVGEPLEDIGDLFSLEEVSDAERRMQEIRAAIGVRQENMRLGFNFYQLYVYDCARVFASLPRTASHPKALAIREGVNTWTRPGSANPMVPGMALLDQFDFLTCVNMIPYVSLDRYRMLAIHDPALLRDATLNRVDAWLKGTPGLLYIHRNLSADNGREDSTVDDLDGTLEADWPWEHDVVVEPKAKSGKPTLGTVTLTGAGKEIVITAAPGGSRFSVKGPCARVLYAEGGKPVLVLWQRPGYLGAVLFDGVEHAGAGYLEALRQVINELAATGIGMPLTAPRLQIAFRLDNLTGGSTTPYYKQTPGACTVLGIELLTGQQGVVLDASHGAAIATTGTYINAYLAVAGGVHAIATKPFESAEQTQGGLLLKSPGLIRVSAPGTVCKVTPVSGRELARISDEQGKSWLVDGAGSEGILELAIPDATPPRTVSYIRAREGIVVTAE